MNAFVFPKTLLMKNKFYIYIHKLVKQVGLGFSLFVIRVSGFSQNKYFNYRLQYLNIFKLSRDSRLISMVLTSFSYLCLVVVVIKCYYDISYIFIVMENCLYVKLLL